MILKTIVLLRLVLLGGVIGVAGHLVANAESLVSTAHGLDFSQVHLVVDVQPEYERRLYKRVRTQLTQAGLIPKSATTYKQGESVFRVTIRVNPAGELPCRLFFYTAKIEVQERVVTERTPRVRAWAVTWSIGTVDEPEVRTTPIAIEELEKDLDNLLDHFLLDYRYANH